MDVTLKSHIESLLNISAFDVSRRPDRIVVKISDLEKNKDIFELLKTLASFSFIALTAGSHVSNTDTLEDVKNSKPTMMYIIF